MLKGLTGVWPLVLLAAFIQGLHLQSRDSSTRPADVYRPVLQRSEALPQIGTYVIRSRKGKACIQVTTGAEYIILENQTSWYFNLDPSRVITNGSCDRDAAVLSLALPDNGASLQFTFRKETKRVYVTELTAHLSPRPVCPNCSNTTYTGSLGHAKLFATKNGESFTCKSENVLAMSPQLRIKLVPLRMQAFAPPDVQFGKEVECWADFKKQVLPIVAGATSVGVILVAVLTFLFIKDRRRPGYHRI